MLSVTKRFEISYSHLLPGYAGPCAQLHGHNAVVEVEFATHSDGSADVPDGTYPGMVVDFRAIKNLVEPIVMRFDHAHLNSVDVANVMPTFNEYPTAENMAICIAKLCSALPHIGALLSRVRVYETSDSYAEWSRSK